MNSTLKIDFGAMWYTYVHNKNFNIFLKIINAKGIDFNQATPTAEGDFWSNIELSIRYDKDTNVCEAQVDLESEEGQIYYDETDEEIFSFLGVDANGLLSIEMDENTHIFSNSLLTLDEMIRNDKNWVTVTDGEILMLYILNDPENKLNKRLTPVAVMLGAYRSSVNTFSPTIDVNNISDEYNYVYATSLKRYYFLTRKELVTNDISRLYLSEDTLTTWDALIRQQTVFVERNENEYDDYIVDELITTEYDKKVERVSLGDLDTNPFYMACYPMMTTISLLNSSRVADPNWLRALRTNSFLETIWQPSIDQFDTIIKEIFNGGISGYAHTGIMQNASDYLVKCSVSLVNPYKFYPVENTNYTKKLFCIGKVFDINIGEDIKLIPHLQINNGAFTLFDINVENDVLTFDNFLDLAPYTRLTLHVPYFEEINIDPIFFIRKSDETRAITLVGQLAVDFTSGSATLYIYRKYAGTHVPPAQPDVLTLIDTKTTNVFIELPVGASNANEQKLALATGLLSLVTGGASTVSDLASGNPMKAVASGSKAVGGFLSNMLKASISHVNSYKGSNGTRDSAFIPFNNAYQMYLIIEKPIVVSSPNLSKAGKPLMEYKYLGDLTGYTLCGRDIIFDPVNTYITMEEIENIKSLLLAGVIL